MPENRNDEKPRRFPCDVVPLVMCGACGWKRPEARKDGTPTTCPMCTQGKEGDR